MVSLEETLHGCEQILADEFEGYSESAFYMIGAIDEAHQKMQSKNKEQSHVQAEDTA